MSFTGILVGVASFFIIGLFHPIVIKTEYHFGKGMWPLFLAAGIAACAGSVFVRDVMASSLLAVLGFTSFWSIKELFDQEERVRKGWFPANPKRAQQNAAQEN